MLKRELNDNFKEAYESSRDRSSLSVFGVERSSIRVQQATIWMGNPGNILCLLGRIGRNECRIISMTYEPTKGNDSGFWNYSDARVTGIRMGWEIDRKLTI